MNLLGASKTLALKAAQALCAAALLLGIFAQTTLAEEFTIKITSGAAAVPGVELRGTHGFDQIPGRFTNGLGEFKFNTVDTGGVIPWIAPSSPDRGYRFVPEIFKPDLNLCQNRVCNVQAVNDGKPSVVIGWSIIDRTSLPVAGIPVTISGPVPPVARKTDPLGMALFVVPKAVGPCSDGNSNSADNFVVGIPNSSAELNCTFETKMLNSGLVCPEASRLGYHTATCSSVNPQQPVGHQSYTVKVLKISGETQTSSLELYGNNGLAWPATTSGGIWSFNTANVPGAGPLSRFNVVPRGLAMQFFPPALDIGPMTCPNNVCTVLGRKVNDSKQVVIKVEVKVADGQTLPAVTLRPTSIESHPSFNPQVTDAQGKAFFAALSRASCDGGNGLFSINASAPGCTFDQSTASICPTGDLNAITISANCSGAVDTGPVAVSGRIIGVQGESLPNMVVLNNQTPVSTSAPDGRYSVIAARGDSLRLSVADTSAHFDPAYASFLRISKNQALDFIARHPIRDPYGSPDLPSCEPQETVAIAGTVYDFAGRPLAGAEIYDGGVRIGVSDQNGAYRFTVDTGTDHWITVGYRDMQFDPAAISLPDIRCGVSDADFKLTDLVSFLLSGKVVDLVSLPMPQARIVLSYRFGNSPEEQRETYTDSSGNYNITVPENAAYSLVAMRSGFNFNPTDYSGQAISNQNELNFRALEPLFPTPTPTNTPTATATFTASNTPTVTATATASRTPTATNTPTNTRTFTATVTASSTPTNTSTATKTISIPTSTATNTATSTATQTSSPTASPSATASYTWTPEPIVTSVPTRRPTYTPSNLECKEVELNDRGERAGRGLSSAIPAGQDQPYFAHLDESGRVLFTYPTGRLEWKTEIIGTNNHHSASAALETALIFKGSDPHIFVYNESYSSGQVSGALRHYYRSANGWQSEIVDTGAGGFPSATLRGDDFYVCYKDMRQNDVKIARGRTGSWDLDLVDATSEITEEKVVVEHDVGDFCDIALDEAGAPIAAYYDRTADALRVSRLKNGSWASQYVTQPKPPNSQGWGYGFYPKIVLSPDGDGDGYVDPGEVPALEIYHSTSKQDDYLESDGSLMVSRPHNNNSGWVTRAAQLGWFQSAHVGGWPSVLYAPNGERTLAVRHKMVSALYGRAGSIYLISSDPDNNFKYNFVRTWNAGPYCIPTQSNINLDRNAQGEFFVSFRHYDGCGGTLDAGIRMCTTANVPTPIPTSTLTPLPTATHTNTATASATATFTATNTNSPTPSKTHTPSITPTSTRTATATNTATATKTPTSTQTFTPTATSTNTATPTNTPIPEWLLTSMCSENPNLTRRWRVRPPAELSQSMQITWVLMSNNSSGQITILPGQDNFFETATVLGTSNTLKLEIPGIPVSGNTLKASSGAACPTATPTATATFTATPTNTATATRTPTPTRTPTNTATPTPFYVVSGAVFGPDGKAISDSYKRELDKGTMLVVKSTDGKGPSINVPMSGNYEFAVPLPRGNYTFALKLFKSLYVASKPAVYKQLIDKSVAGINFSVRTKPAGGSISGAAAGGAGNSGASIGGGSNKRKANTGRRSANLARR